MDKLTTRLAEALRELASRAWSTLSTDEAMEALAAYDERVAAEDFGAMTADVGERLTRMGTALTKLKELSDMAESITSGMKKPAIPAALVPVPDGRVLVPRPSVGRTLAPRHNYPRTDTGD